jgi:hypothetical protein
MRKVSRTSAAVVSHLLALINQVLRYRLASKTGRLALTLESVRAWRCFASEAVELISSVSVASRNHRHAPGPGLRAAMDFHVHCGSAAAEAGLPEPSVQRGVMFQAASTRRGEDLTAKRAASSTFKSAFAIPALGSSGGDNEPLLCALAKGSEAALTQIEGMGIGLRHSHNRIVVSLNGRFERAGKAEGWHGQPLLCVELPIAARETSRIAEKPAAIDIPRYKKTEAEPPADRPLY